MKCVSQVGNWPHPDRLNPITGIPEMLVNDPPYGKIWWPIVLLLWLCEDDSRIISPDQAFEMTCGNKACYNPAHLQILWTN